MWRTTTLPQTPMNRRQEEEVKRMTATKDGAGRCVRCVILEFLSDGNALDIRDRKISAMQQTFVLTTLTQVKCTFALYFWTIPSEGVIRYLPLVCCSRSRFMEVLRLYVRHCLSYYFSKFPKIALKIEQTLE